MLKLLAGALIAGGWFLAGCGPAARQVDNRPHVRGQPVDGPTFSRLLYSDNSSEYYANDAELKLAIQRKAEGHSPTTAPE